MFKIYIDKRATKPLEEFASLQNAVDWATRCAGASWVVRDKDGVVCAKAQ